MVNKAYLVCMQSKASLFFASSFVLQCEFEQYFFFLKSSFFILHLNIYVFNLCLSLSSSLSHYLLSSPSSKPSAPMSECIRRLWLYYKVTVDVQILALNTILILRNLLYLRSLLDIFKRNFSVLYCPPTSNIYSEGVCTHGRHNISSKSIFFLSYTCSPAPPMVALLTVPSIFSLFPPFLPFFLPFSFLFPSLSFSLSILTGSYSPYYLSFQYIILQLVIYQSFHISI